MLLLLISLKIKYKNFIWITGWVRFVKSNQKFVIMTRHGTLEGSEGYWTWHIICRRRIIRSNYYNVIRPRLTSLHHYVSRLRNRRPATSSELKLSAVFISRSTQERTDNSQMYIYILVLTWKVSFFFQIIKSYYSKNRPIFMVHLNFLILLIHITSCTSRFHPYNFKVAEVLF